LRIGPTGYRLGGDPADAARIKRWVAEALGAGGETTVMVAELRCAEPGCPPVETSISVLDKPGEPRQRKIHKPMSDVTRDDVLHLFAPEA
jgi:hypothetical protein